MKKYIKIRISDSSLIDRVAYSAKETTLVVMFRSGRTYQYEKVGASIFKEFLASESKGQFYNSRIRGHYEAQELT